jgi:hypothetical protein
MKSSRRAFGPHPWTIVPEYGSLGRLHGHLMLPSTVDAQELVSHWSLGMTSIVHLPTVPDIKHFSAYLGKNFDKTRGHRPFSHRYIPAPGFAPEWIDYGYATREEAEILAQQQAGDYWLTVRRWDYSSDWCSGGFEWDVDAPCPGGLVEEDDEFLERIGAIPCDCIDH